MGFKSILCISDMHFPFAHRDITPFLTAIKKKYKPDHVVSIGDEVDYHAISYHENEYGALSASDELELAKSKIEPLFSLFPRMDIIESNHGSLVYRKGKTAGLPHTVFKSYNEILGAPSGWKWHYDLILDLGKKNGQIYFNHGLSGNPLKTAESVHMHTVEGHYHGKFQTTFKTGINSSLWSMHIGCLIDAKSFAFNYGKSNLKQPVIGCGIILNGIPKLIPMRVGKTNRWNGVVD